jgi:hypothetical protein
VFRDYGNRVGVFRLMAVLVRHANVAPDSGRCAQHPACIEEGEDT